MGCAFSRRVFKVNADLEGQDESALEVFHQLGLSQHDIDLLFTAFWDIDADGSGQVRPAELFHYFEVEGTHFELALFSLFDEDGSGVINFMEFVCTLWNLLTLPERHCAVIAYMIKDHSTKGDISYSDVQALLELMFKRHVSADPALSAMIASLRKTYPPRLQLADFSRFVSEHPYLCNPLVMLQLHLRRQIIGENFWRELAQKRERDFGDAEKHIDYVLTLQQEVKAKNEVFRKRLQLAQQQAQALQRLGQPHSGGAGQGARAQSQGRINILRKESRLLSFFQQKSRSRWFKAEGDEDGGAGVGKSSKGSKKGGREKPQRVAPHSSAAASRSIEEDSEEDSEDEKEDGIDDELMPTNSKKGSKSKKVYDKKKKKGKGKVKKNHSEGNQSEDMQPRDPSQPEYNPNIILSTNAAATGAPPKQKHVPEKNRRRRSQFKPKLVR